MNTHLGLAANARHKKGALAISIELSNISLLLCRRGSCWLLDMTRKSPWMVMLLLPKMIIQKPYVPIKHAFRLKTYERDEASALRSRFRITIAVVQIYSMRTNMLDTLPPTCCLFIDI